MAVCGKGADFKENIKYGDKEIVCPSDKCNATGIDTGSNGDKKLTYTINIDNYTFTLNKILRVRGVTGKNIVGGMSNYNDPEMSFMTELFDRNTVKVAAQIPFDEDVYAKYLEGLIECEIKLNGYPKEFKAKLTTLAETIYPLLPNNNNNGKKNKKNSKQGYSSNNQYPNSFSSGMNDTLNSMRNRY